MEQERPYGDSSLGDKSKQWISAEMAEHKQAS